jgi:hypothetical protein
MTTLITKDEVLKMAEQCGLPEFENNESQAANLVMFAKLIADKKHEELYRLAEDAPVRGDARQTRQNILHAIRARGEPTLRGEA